MISRDLVIRDVQKLERKMTVRNSLARDAYLAILSHSRDNLQHSCYADVVDNGMRAQGCAWA